MPYLNIEEIEPAVIALAATYPGTCQVSTLPKLTHQAPTTHAMRIGLGALIPALFVAFIFSRALKPRVTG